jgi:exopolyphosphatase/pppGpp-phosphohydrolase
MRTAPRPNVRPAFGLLATLLLVPAPARAELYGGIEIGAKGVKATVIDARPTPDGLHVKVLLAGTHNATLVAGVASSGKFDPATLKDAARAVRRYAEEMEKRYKVPKENIYVVGSSGIFTPIATDARAVAANRARLAKAVRETAGRSMDFITVEQEADLSILGIVPRKLLGTSLLIDIGSGNTKGGAWVKKGEFDHFGIPFGSVTFGERVKKDFGKDGPVKGSERLRREVVRPALKTALNDHPGLRKRNRVYLSGGACWALATFTRPGDRSPYVALSAKDIDSYHKMLVSRPGEYPPPDLDAIRDPAARKEAEKDLARARKAFTPEQLLAGAEILKALSAEFELGGDKSMYFARNGYLGWILAYAARKGSRP